MLDYLDPWHVLWLSSVRFGSPWLALPAERAFVEEEADGGADVLDTTRDPDVWRRSLPKNMREGLRKASRRAGHSGGYQCLVSTGHDVAERYDKFVLLEASGWKGQEKTDLSHTPVTRKLLGDYLQCGDDTEVRSLHIGGRLAASQVCVRVARTLFLLKVAYDEQLAHFSPGNLLMADLIEKCCEDPKIDRIDCVVWQPWHQRWGMTREPTFRVTAFNPKSARGCWPRPRGLPCRSLWHDAAVSNS